MSTDPEKQKWDAYRAAELVVIAPILLELGYELAPEQPHTSGERYLMQAVTTASGKKLILLGTRVSDGHRVVIKTAQDAGGKREITKERTARAMLPHINFAYRVFHSPTELFFGIRGERLISIQSYIEQERAFLARPLEEQFSLALSAFKAQESAHATTYGHSRSIRNVFETMSASDYVRNFSQFKTDTERELPDNTHLHTLLTTAERELTKNEETIAQYCGFLTHSDFVPHNLRVKDGSLYLLDHSSLRFGNKYESWARFINFMVLHNPPLAEALVEYVQLNRTPEESQALKLMRLYRLGEIIWYYTDTLKKCSGDLRTLNGERVHFWSQVLEAVLHDQTLSETVRAAYIEKRDQLRSSDEKQRQKDLH